MRSLDPNAVPPSSPKTKPLIDPPTDLTTSGADHEAAAAVHAPAEEVKEAKASTDIPPSESISNLLVGQRGVNRLFQDFVSAISAKEKEVRRLSDRLEELEHTLSTVTDQLNTETSLRIEAESARETIMRDDASAAKVVERYMTFTQKTHATVHLHLDNLRSRSAATQHSLRKEIAVLRAKLAGETGRAERLRLALDDASENLSREVAGRRREVGLRLKMISNEEKRERKVEIWLDRVRRTREGVEGAVVEADILEGLLDEGVEAYSVDPASASFSTSVSKDKQRSWRGMTGILGGGRRKSVSVNGHALDAERSEASSIARVLLAEELVDTLVKDLQVETERRMALESQRVDWLAKEAVEGREAGEGGDVGDGVMFDLDQHEDGEMEVGGTSRRESITAPVDNVKTNTETVAMAEAEAESKGSAIPEVEAVISHQVSAPAPLETPPDLAPTPAVTDLLTIFQPLRARYDPLQSSLHSLSHSLADLRSSLPIGDYPDAPPSPNVPRKPILPFRRSPLSDPLLTSILDNLHETLEDARVDVEIAIADEDRVYRGFEALLGVGTGVVQSKDVLKDAREFVDFKMLGEGFAKLSSKVGDLEDDLSSLKAKIHELDGMDLSSPTPPGDAGSDTPPVVSPTTDTPTSSSAGFFKSSSSVWTSLSLKSVDVTPPVTPSPSIEEGRRKLGSGMFGGVSNVGRSFSASVISAPRKVGGFAGGLYRPRRKGQGQGRDEKGKEEEQRLVKDDDGDVE